MRLSSLALTLVTLSESVLGATPTKLGILLYPGYQAIDAYGPLDLINILSWRTYLNLTILTSDGLPVSTKNPNAAMMTRSNSTVEEYTIATHSFENAPPIEVLFVPGGLGNRDVPLIQPAVDYIREVYPSLQYLITVCTGAGLAARAGVLDGKKATTNKWAFYATSLLGPKTWWVSKARWVVDGNIWTSSGVSAGIDVTLAWIEHVWGTATAEDLATGMEHDWHRDASWDPFSTKWNISDVIYGVTQPPSISPTPTPTPSSSISLPVTTSSSLSTITTKNTKTSKTTTARTTKTTKTTKTAKATTTNKEW